MNTIYSSLFESSILLQPLCVREIIVVSFIIYRRTSPANLANLISYVTCMCDGTILFYKAILYTKYNDLNPH